MSEPRRAQHETGGLFVEFLRQGPDADLESWCRRHPAHAPRLRALHDSYQSVLELLREAGITLGTPSPSAPPRVSAHASPASRALLRGIVAQGPKGSRYRIEGEVARGGMGAILRVHDDDLGRDLAMKVVLGRESAEAQGSSVDERTLLRFLDEAQITGQLEHPGVVPVHEIGLDGEGRVYFTMRLVKGRTLEEVFRLAARGEQGWTRTRALGVLLRVCEAVAYAHSRGVVHRDLKPTNVMVGGFGEVYVMDWGLAHTASRSGDEGSVHTLRTDERERTNDPAFATLYGEVLGTPSFMPPEQARGAHDLVTARADVYAVGAMLYHLLARRPPYARSAAEPSSGEVLEALLAGPPTALRELAPEVPDELAAITEKAMARDIDARYASMLELADDLRAYLEGRVVRAHQTGAWVELRKWVARNRALSAAAAAALVFLVAGLAASLWQRGIALENAAFAAERATAAAASARRAEAARDFLASMLSEANPVKTLQSDLLVADVLEAAAARIDAGAFADDPESEYALRGTLGDAFKGISRLEESERQYRRALELFDARVERDPLERIALLGDLDDTLIVRGKLDEVERSARARLDGLDALAVGDHPQRVRALKQLAAARYQNGDTEGALELTGAALAICARIYGEDDPLTARTRSKLAFYLSRDGRYDESMAEADRAVAVLEAGSLADRFEATEVMRTRARIHLARRNNTDAIGELERGLAVRRELFSGDGLQVANFEVELGGGLNVVGRLDEADVLLRHALEIRRRVLGDHVDTALALTSVGALAIDRGELAEGRALLLEARDMRVRLLGPDSPAVADSDARLGLLSLREADPVAAEGHLREALRIWQATIGAEHPDVGAVWWRLGQALRAQGRFGEAREALEAALAIHEREFGVDGPVTRETRDEWYRLMLQMGENEAVLAALDEALQQPFNRVGPSHAYMDALRGAALAGMGRYEEAEPLLLEGWRVMGPDERLWPVNKLAVLDALVNFYVAIEDESEAERYRALAAELR